MTCWLLEHGVDVNKAADAGETALMTAAGSSGVELVSLLLSRGADVDAQCKAGCTALHLAVAQGGCILTSVLKQPLHSRLMTLKASKDVDVVSIHVA